MPRPCQNGRGLNECNWPVTRPTLGSVRQLSAEGFAVLTEMSASAQRPRVLYAAFLAGRAPVADLPGLIAFAWLRDDSPTSDLSEGEWLQIYAAAGFFSYPQERALARGPRAWLWRSSSSSQRKTAGAP